MGFAPPPRGGFAFSWSARILPHATTARARGEALWRLERDRDALIESYVGTVGDTLEDLSPEERHRVYKLLRLDVRVRADWPLEISGIFAQVAEEGETGLSYRNPSPRSV